MSTTTTISPESAAASSALGHKLHVCALLIDIANAASVMTPPQQSIACAVIANNSRVSSIETEKNLATVAEVLKNRIGSGASDASDLLPVIAPIHSVIMAKQYGKLVDLIDTAPAATTPEPQPVTEAPAPAPEPEPAATTTEPEPIARRRRKSTTMEVPPPVVPTLSIPEVVLPDAVKVPEVVINPADPMSVMAQSIARHLQPVIDAAAKANDVAVLSAIKPTIDAIVQQLGAVRGLAAAGGGKADPAAIAKVIDEKLNNGAGAEVRRIVGVTTPAVLSDVLAKAAEAIAATAPVEPGAAKLTAALIRSADPNYAWTKELSALAEMIETSSNAKPQNAMLVGPTGCGKTDFAEQFAAKYGRPCLIMDCANLREAREWFGIKGVSNGATYFRKSQFWLAVEQGNCVIVLDEFNRAPDHVRNPLMPILDHRRRSFVEEVGELLTVGPRTVFFATMNEGLDYSGTHTTDRAMKNRFPRRIELNYLPAKQEVKVLIGKVAGLNTDDAEKLVELANTIRQKATGFGGSLSETLSTRQLIAAAEDFVVAGPKSFQTTVFNHYSAEGGTDSERAQVVNMFQLKGYKLA